ncbi:MAG: energy transducer TonB [Candidatus Cloacimonadales bacterium]
MASKYKDWKIEANGYLIKGMAMSVVLIMFLLLVMPRFESSETEDKIDDSAQVSEHFEFEEVVEKEEVIEEEVIEEEKDIIDDNVEIDMNFDELDIEATESAVVRTTISATDELDLNISFSDVDETSEATPFVIHEDMPTIIKQVRVIFPDIAKQNNVEGTVVVEAWVKVDGTVGNVRVITSVQNIPGGLDDAAVKAVWQWTFEPAKSGGKPVACWVKIPLNLKLED